MRLITLVALIIFGSVKSCRPKQSAPYPYPNPYPYPSEQNQKPEEKIIDTTTSQPDLTAEGWDRPPGWDQEWGKGSLVKEPGQYNVNVSASHAAGGGQNDEYGEENPNFPDRWKGLDKSYGVYPPPWGYIPQNIGKPSYCYQPPMVGLDKCPPQQRVKTQYRFGYNPWMDKCQKFPYNGCGGNNFRTEKRCTEICGGLPEPECDGENEPIDDLKAYFEGN